MSVITPSTRVKVEDAIAVNNELCKTFNSENLKLYEAAWQSVIDDYKSQFYPKLAILTPKARWQFAFCLLLQLDECFSFDCNMTHLLNLTPYLEQG